MTEDSHLFIHCLTQHHCFRHYLFIIVTCNHHIMALSFTHQSVDLVSVKKHDRVVFLWLLYNTGFNPVWWMFVPLEHVAYILYIIPKILYSPLQWCLKLHSLKSQFWMLPVTDTNPAQVTVDLLHFCQLWLKWWKCSWSEEKGELSVKNQQVTSIHIMSLRATIIVFPCSSALQE